jgi:hypothetical protein
MPRGPSALWRRSLVLVSCGLLAAGLLTSCTSHSTAAASQHPRPAPAIGPPPTAALPAGQKLPVRVSAVSAYMDQSNDLLWGSGRQIGPAYQFAVAMSMSPAAASATRSQHDDHQLILGSCRSEVTGAVLAPCRPGGQPETMCTKS